MAAKKIKKSKGDIIFDIINYTFFTLFMLLCVFPFYYVGINSISANNLVDTGKIMFYPVGVHFNNYIEVLKMERMGRAAWISVARTVLGTALSTLGASYMAYLFTKQHMWKRKLWYRLVIATMYFSAGLIPGYLNCKMLGLTNTFWIYVIPGIFPVYNMVLIKTYMESISPALEESDRRRGLFRPLYPHRHAAVRADSGHGCALQRGRPLEFLYGHADLCDGLQALHAAIPAL